VILFYEKDGIVGETMLYTNVSELHIPFARFLSPYDNLMQRSKNE
jgi:hypothetical protein